MLKFGILSPVRLNLVDEYNYLQSHLINDDDLIIITGKIHDLLINNINYTSKLNLYYLQCNEIWYFDLHPNI